MNAYEYLLRYIKTLLKQFRRYIEQDLKSFDRVFIDPINVKKSIIFLTSAKYISIELPNANEPKFYKHESLAACSTSTSPSFSNVEVK